MKSIQTVQIQDAPPHVPREARARSAPPISPNPDSKPYRLSSALLIDLHTIQNGLVYVHIANEGTRLYQTNDAEDVHVGSCSPLNL